MEKRNKKIIILLSGALLMILLITAIINITKIKEMFVEKKQAADISKLISVNGTYKDGVSKDGTTAKYGTTYQRPAHIT